MDFIIGIIISIALLLMLAGGHNSFFTNDKLIKATATIRILNKFFMGGLV
jgi:hypothetical protein